MSDILQVVGGAMLLCIPVSFVLTIFYMSTYLRKFGEMEIEDFFLIWLFMYLCLLVFAAVGFAGIAGIAMLTGAFR